MSDRIEVAGTGISRREYLLATGAISTSALAGCVTESPTPSTITDHSSPDLEKWVDEVSRPTTVDPTGTKNGQPYYEVELREIEQTIHRDLPPTTVWGYDGQYPGPTIEAQHREPIYVR